MPANDPIVDGDTHFLGVNMRLDPGQLKPGFCASAKNKRFVNGKASTRPGIKKMPWSNKAADAWVEQTYATDAIVTYSGRAAVVTGSTQAQVDGGTGVLVATSTNAAITIGDFRTNTSWLVDGETSGGNPVGGLGGSSGWSGFAGPTAATHAASSGADNLYQDISAVLGGDYQITVTLSGVTASSGTLTAQIGTTNPPVALGLAGGYSTNGTYTVTATSSGQKPGRLYLQASAGFVGTVDDVTVTEGATPERVTLIPTTELGTNSFQAGGPISQENTLGPFYKRKSLSFTINNPTGGAATDGVNAYTVGSHTASGIVVDATPHAVYFGDIITFSNGGKFLVSESAIITATLIKGTLTVAALSDNDTGAIEMPPLTTASTQDEHTTEKYWESLGHRTYGYGTVYGTGIFRDPASIEYVLVAAADGVYATKEGNPSTKLAGVSSISTDVEFVQCFNTVVMFQGDDVEPLSMTRIDIGFVSISQTDTDITIDENEDDGTEKIPNASTGLFFANRLLIPHSKDLVAASDFLNYTRYSPVMSNFRINQGSEDELVSLVRINNSTIACFKTNSIYMVYNIYGNMSDITLDEVTREYGAVGKNSIVQVGDDVVFLSSKKGVTSLGVAQNGKVSAVDVPMSEPIQPLIDRINWNAASGAAAAYHNNRLYMAVPLDGSSYNNAILVFDYLAGGWAGYDTGNAIKVKSFLETTHQGKRRLFFLDTDGFINLYDDALTECGFVDELPKSTDSTHADFGNTKIEQISDEIITRGYTAGDISSKKWQSAEVHLATNDSDFTISAQFDGPEEDDLALTPTGGQTFSRTTYDRPFDKTDFTQSMVDNDFATKYRGDYSVKLAGETDGVDAVLLVGTCSNTAYNASQEACEVSSSGRTWTYNTSDAGFDPDLHQQSQNRYRYRGEGRYVQLKVANTNGRAELVAAKVGAIPGQNLTNKAI
jgi:hypothetical protein